MASTPAMSSRCYRIALLAFPTRLRSRYGDEMVATFTAAHAQRRGLSRRAGRRFAARACFDTVGAGIGARFGSGVGPPTGFGRGKVRAAREWLWLELGADVRAALRTLRKEPVFALTVIAVLALGVGINGALSNALRAVFLAPAPFAEPERMVILDLTLEQIGNTDPPGTMVWSYPKYELLAGTDDLAASPIAAYAKRGVTLTGRGNAQEFTTEIVTPDYFAVLGMPAWRGTEELTSDQAMLSHGLAQTLFGDTNPVGQEVILNGMSQTVAGVAPPGFRGLTGIADLWISMAAVTRVISPSLIDNYQGHWLLAVGRLRPDRTLEELQAQMQAVGARVQDAYEWTDTIQSGTARSFEEARRNPRARQAVAVVSAAAGLVLLIACVNLAVLLHARMRGRQREIAVRLALGSSRFRVARILLVEVLLLAAGAGFVGVGVASTATRAIARAWPQSFVNGNWNLRFVDAAGLQFDLPAAIVTFMLAGVAGMLFALLPILRVTRTDVAAAMRAGGRTETGRDATGRWLVAAEVAIALVLTVGAGLMISSLGRLTSVERGFDSRNVLAFEYVLERGSVEAEDPAMFHDEFVRRVRALPGVVGATLECGSPLDGHCWITSVRRAGEQRWEEAQQRAIGVHLVDEAYFATLDVPLRVGRLFNAEDGADTPAVMLLNEAAARDFFPQGNALGQPITVGVDLTSGEDTAEVIGIVGDVLYDSPAEGIMPEAYVLHRQEPGRSTSVLVRAAGAPLELLPLLRAELAELAPDVPLTNARTIESMGIAQLGDTTVVMRLLAAFAALAVLLSATGVWGTVAQAVGQRRREMGIRMALGAQAWQVVRQSLQYGLVWATGGAVVGLVGSYYLSRTLTSLLFEVNPTDALAYTSSALLLILISIVASYVPARRAGQVDPAKILRAE